VNAAAAVRPDSETALYVYALVREDAPAPACEGAVLPGLPIASAKAGGVAALFSVVPRDAFAGETAMARDPGWVAERASAHHRLLESLAPAPCLPLRFGTLFADRHSLVGWLEAEAAAATAALERLQGKAEWSVSLLEDEAVQLPWLRANDAGLHALVAQHDRARPGAAFLIGKRIARAEATARTAHTARMAEEVDQALRAQGCEILLDAAATRPNWAMLVPHASDIRSSVATLADQMRPAGLDVRLTGPWPPYAFAQAYWPGVAA
jgi:hypothetical protein